MRLALVYPEVYDLARFHERRKEYPPFGVLYLAAVVEEAGEQVEILKVSPGRTVLDLRRFDAVGFSISSSASYGVIKESRARSLYAKDALVMVGGVHANFYPEETLLDIQPDVVAFGEGEETILELLAERKTRRFDRVRGVCYVDNGSAVRTMPRPVMRDIDTLPLPARHLLDSEDYVMEDRLSNTDLRMAHVMFSRGCPFPCRFCGAAQTRIQYRSGASARKELVYLRDHHDIDGFAIVDDNFVVNKRKVADICETVRDLDLRWSALSRVDTIDEPLARAMQESGCIEIKFGMESGSERMLKAMRKNITQDQIRTALGMTARLGVKVKVFLIHGFPGENAESTAETLALLRELEPLIERATLFRFVPLPGTYVYDNPHEFDLHGTNRDPDWDGDWSKYHIIRNESHWWGTNTQFREMDDAYRQLNDYIEETWPRDRWNAPSQPERLAQIT